MNVNDKLEEQSELRGDEVALIDRAGRRTRTTSYRGLQKLVGQTARRLTASGLCPADRVIVLLPMSLELYVVLLALFKQQLTAVIFDPSAGIAHIERCCKMASPKAILAGPRAHLLGIVSPELRRIPHKFVANASLWKQISAEAPDWSPCLAEGDTPALLTFTSGSTGEPKAALRTHGFLIAQHLALEESLGLTAGSVDMATLPIFVLANLASGVTSIIPDADLRFPGLIAPRPLVAQIDRHAPESIGASPALLERVAAYCEMHGRTLPTFNRVFTGGAPVFPKLLDRLQRVCPNAEIVALYGSTEAEPIAHVSRSAIGAMDFENMRTGGGLLAGPPEPSITLKIVRAARGRRLDSCSATEFAALVCAQGESGEIVVTGDHVLKGYWQGRGDLETKFVVNGAVWHRTGDCGYLDSNGRVWLLGRAAATIQDDRGIVFPFAVECAVHDFPGLVRSALVQLGGKRVLAMETSRALSDAQRKQIHATLSWAEIDEIRPITHIPVDHRRNAKVDYVSLRRMLRK